MREIPLTQGKVALVDDADYEWLSQWKWCVMKQRNGDYYAVRGKRSATGQGRLEYMHRVLLDVPSGHVADHIDGDGLNNCRANLRVATPSQNGMNSRSHRGASSRYRGVSWDASRGRWSVELPRLPGIRYHVGRFLSEEDAARAYDLAVLGAGLEYARLNFRRDEYESQVDPCRV